MVAAVSGLDGNGAFCSSLTCCKVGMTDGALSEKHKEFMALAVGITEHCSGCIGFHIKALHRLACSRHKLEELLSVSVHMGGGPALMRAAEALTACEGMALAMA